MIFHSFQAAQPGQDGAVGDRVIPLCREEGSLSLVEVASLAKLRVTSRYHRVHTILQSILMSAITDHINLQVTVCMRELLALALPTQHSLTMT